MNPLTATDRTALLDALFDRPAANPPPADLHWDAIVQAAGSHGCAPLLFAAVREREDLPQEARKRLQAHTYATAMRNHHLQQAGQEIIETLQAAGIRARLLKGLSLARRLYNDPALRPSDDIDVLVPPAQVPHAVAVLAERDYHLPGYLLPLAYYRAHHFHIPLVRASAPRVYLEIHWNLTDRFLLFTPDIEGVLSSPGPDLQPAHELVYLAMHLAKHAVLNRTAALRDPAVAERLVFCPQSDIRLLWLVDAWRWMHRIAPETDPKAIRRTADAWGARAALSDLLVLVWSVARQPLPATLEGLVREPAAGARPGLAARLAAPRGSDLPGASWWVRMHPALQFRPIRFLDVARYVAPPADYLRRRYGCRRRPAIWGCRVGHACRAVFRDLLAPAATALYLGALRRLRTTDS